LYSIDPFNYFNQSSINCQPDQFGLSKQLMQSIDLIVLNDLVNNCVESQLKARCIQYLFLFDKKKYILVDQKISNPTNLATICQW